MINMKTIMGIAQAIPAFSGIISKTLQRGKIDRQDVLQTLTAFSPDFKKCADEAISTVERGGTLQDAISKVYNYGEFTLPIGNIKINPRTMSQELKQKGLPGLIIGNVMDWLFKQDEKDIVAWGEEASDLRNWVSDKP